MALAPRRVIVGKGHRGGAAASTGNAEQADDADREQVAGDMALNWGKTEQRLQCFRVVMSDNRVRRCKEPAIQ